jgi:hypothetical protein
LESWAVRRMCLWPFDIGYLSRAILQISAWSPGLGSFIHFSSYRGLLASLSFFLCPERHYNRLGEVPGVWFFPYRHRPLGGPGQGFFLLGHAWIFWLLSAPGPAWLALAVFSASR